MMPARPTRPVPSNPRVPGSGVTIVSPLTKPAAETWKPPATGTPFKAYITLTLLPITVALPLNVPWNKVCELLLVIVIIPPVNAHPTVQVPSPGILTTTVPNLPAVLPDAFTIVVSSDEIVRPADALPVTLAVGGPNMPEFP